MERGLLCKAMTAATTPDTAPLRMRPVVVVARAPPGPTPVERASVVVVERGSVQLSLEPQFTTLVAAAAEDTTLLAGLTAARVTAAARAYMLEGLPELRIEAAAVAGQGQAIPEGPEGQELSSSDIQYRERAGT
jgi:hypothetical protein